jgi:predicted site-specific integrase-resolvase
VPDSPRLVSSTVAADAIGVDPTTLWRWYKAGQATPALITPGGHLRWDLDQLQAQLSTSPPEKRDPPEPPRA